MFPGKSLSLQDCNIYKVHSFRKGKHRLTERVTGSTSTLLLVPGLICSVHWGPVPYEGL